MPAKRRAHDTVPVVEKLYKFAHLFVLSLLQQLAIADRIKKTMEVPAALMLKMTT